MYYSHFQVTEDPQTKLGVFVTIPAIENIGLNLFSEALGTFVLVFATSVFVLGAPQTGNMFVPFVISSIGMSLGGTTGYAINPARDLGPRLVHHFFPLKDKGDSKWSYDWVPIVGPIIGALLATLLAYFII